MKILILGAGATGGYFGGRLAHAGVDVTFLVRDKRSAQLARDGLVIESPRGNVVVPVSTVTAGNIGRIYDVAVLSAKAYDLQSAIAAIQPALSATGVVLPVLNGMRHLDILDETFGPARVLGGTCHISSTLTDSGTIQHFSGFDALTLGPRISSQNDVCQQLHTLFSRGAFEARLSNAITGVMWEKWVLLATLAGMTCLMRGHIGEIVAANDGTRLISAMLDECCAVAAASGYPPKQSAITIIRDTLTDPASAISASMLRDLQGGRRIEADHIVGDLIARGSTLGVATPLLKVAYTQLQVYQRRLMAQH